MKNVNSLVKSRILPDGKTTKSRRPYSGKPGASRPRKRNEE